ncbi:MAG: hypothetical protein LQ351_007444 [Letrouitia transgressa]|nr:MAG: hypothetical protein LQ351_007444 [Letrouitia transgressa]
MISSINGTIGQATESNYSAANGFLDAFARYRRSLELPGTSIALGPIKGVGYLAENPKAESILERQGFHAIDEGELLLLMDLAISGCEAYKVGNNAKTHHDHHRNHACMLTGLGGQLSVQRIMDDARASILASTASRMNSIDRDGDSGAANGTEGGAVLPRPVKDALSVGDEKALHAAVLSRVANNLAALVQMPAEQVTARTRLVDVGMDSMLAVEARQAANLGIDVPLVDLMASTATVGDIGLKVAEGLLKQSTKR